MDNQFKQKILTKWLENKSNVTIMVDGDSENAKEACGPFRFMLPYQANNLHFAVTTMGIMFKKMPVSWGDDVVDNFSGLFSWEDILVLENHNSRQVISELSGANTVSEIKA